MRQKRRTKRFFQRRGVWAIGVLAALGGWFLFSDYGILTRIRLERSDSHLDQAIIVEQKRLDSLRAYRSRLHNDTLLLEQIARERYGMIRPGETVIIIVDSTH